MEGTEYSEQIKILARELSELKRQLREENKVEARKYKKILPRGRQPLDSELIEKAKELAKTKTLTDVALRLGISLRSLYNKGISRQAIDAENKIKDDL